MNSNLQDKSGLSPVSRLNLESQKRFQQPGEDIQEFNHLSDMSRIHYKESINSINEQSCATIHEMTKMLERKKVPVDNQKLKFQQEGNKENVFRDTNMNVGPINIMTGDISNKEKQRIQRLNNLRPIFKKSNFSNIQDSIKNDTKDIQKTLNIENNPNSKLNEVKRRLNERKNSRKKLFVCNIEKSDLNTNRKELEQIKEQTIKTNVQCIQIKKEDSPEIKQKQNPRNLKHFEKIEEFSLKKSYVDSFFPTLVK